MVGQAALAKPEAMNSLRIVMAAAKAWRTVAMRDSLSIFSVYVESSIAADLSEGEAARRRLVPIDLASTNSYYPLKLQTSAAPTNNQYYKESYNPLFLPSLQLYSFKF